MPPTPESTHGALELVVFKLKDDADKRRFVEAAETAKNWMIGQPGFVSRELCHSNAEDRWVEVVWWATMEQAESAAEAAATSESCAPMFSMIDLDSALMLHGEPALTFLAG